MRDLRRLEYLADRGDVDAGRFLAEEELRRRGWTLRVMRGATMAETLRLEQRRRLRLYIAAAKSARLRRMLLGRSAGDPLFWFDHFAWTYDHERSGGNGTPHIPLVLLDWQRDIPRLFLGVGGPQYRNAQGDLWPVCHDKSRKLGATWIPLEALTWDWLFRAGADYGVMTRSGTDLDGIGGTQTLFGKIDHIIDRLPPWMRPPGLSPKRHRSHKPGSPSWVNPRTGAVIEGSATVLDPFRGKRHRRDFVDEAASIQRFAAVMASLNDVSKATWAVSTPKGMGNHFARIVHGDGVQTREFGEQGLGWLHIRTHYSQHPERVPGTPQGDAWIEAERAKRTDEEWAQEQEIDYQASAPGRIWPEWNSATHIYTADAWAHQLPFLERAEIIEGWDFGSGPSLTAVVWAAYVEATDTLYLLDYRVWRESHYDAVADGVAAAGWLTDKTPNGRRPHRRVGDVAGKQRGSDQRSWISNLQTRAIRISGRLIAGEQVRSTIRKKIRDERLFGAPEIARRYKGQQSGTPTLAETMAQYRRQIRGSAEDYVGETPPPRKDAYSHLADCVQYIVDEIWPTSAVGIREQDNPRGYTP